MKKLPRFEKYFHYIHSVQSAEHDAELLLKMYQKTYKNSARESLLMQEDFCATAQLCYEWVKQSKTLRAVGIDLDADALDWGSRHHGQELTERDHARIKTICGNVLDNHALNPELICALNFSYFFIEDRQTLLQYFKNCRNSLHKEGLLVLDAFGGPDYLLPHEDKRRNSEHKFNYWWVVESFDAISHQMTCHLHFQRDGEKIRKRVFSYQWRLWSIPEIRDLLYEAGFKSIEYWAEGVDKNGDGNGNFRPVRKESDCRSWVCYLVAS